MATISISSGSSPAIQGSTLVLRADVPGYSGWSMTKWSGAGYGDQATTTVKTDTVGTFVASVSISTLQGTKTASASYDVIAKPPDPSPPPPPPPVPPPPAPTPTDTDDKVICSAGYYKKNGTCYPNKTVDVECPAGNKWNSDKQVCETVATALQAKADAHLDSTDVFNKNQRDDTPPDVITFPMLIGVGILYIFLSATR